LNKIIYSILGHHYFGNNLISPEEVKESIEKLLNFNEYKEIRRLLGSNDDFKAILIKFLGLDPALESCSLDFIYINWQRSCTNHKLNWVSDIGIGEVSTSL